MFKKLITISIVTLLCQYALGQTIATQAPPASNGQSLMFPVASTNAGSLGRYGQVPVGNFNGIASPEIKLYDLKFKELSVPISLSYYAAGNKVDEFPGPVGLGWSLIAGGSITRVVNGLADLETYEGNAIVPELSNPTDSSNWATLAKMNKYLEGYTSSNDISNSDEYYFNFNGISGKFYVDSKGAYQVKSTNGIYLKIQGDTAVSKWIKVQKLEQRLDRRPNQVEDSIYKRKIFYSFTITDPNGTKYRFGGNDSSIEFSRQGHNVSGFNDAPTQNELKHVLSWWLTEIESINGYKIKFNYEWKTFQTKAAYTKMESYIWSNRYNNPDLTTGGLNNIAFGQVATIVNACFLKTITTPDQTISFSKSAAKNQLMMPVDTFLYMPGNMSLTNFSAYWDVMNAFYDKLLPLRFDTINVRESTGKLNRRIVFEYSNQKDTRMKLNGIAISGGNYLAAEMYSFTYNSTPLPPYLSRKMDGYGFYNGRNNHILTKNPQYYLNIDSTAFMQSKEPDSSYVQAEILTKITYPTGGYTEFTYEPNKYGSYVTTWPFAVQTNAGTTDKITGGVRIKKVTQRDSDGKFISEKRYFYVKNWRGGGSASSGVLSYQPVFIDRFSGPVTAPLRKAGQLDWSQGTATVKRFNLNPIYIMGSPNGHHITYSEVTEVDTDGGFAVFKYQNYDNGFNDTAPLSYVCDNTNIKEFYKEDPGISMELERGLVSSIEKYDASKVIKSKQIFKYNDDPNRFNQNIRYLHQVPNSINEVDIPSYRVQAGLRYTYYPFLKTETTINYGINNDSLILVKNFSYDSIYKNTLKVETLASDSTKKVEIFKYPAQMVALGATIPYTGMLNMGMTATLVEKENRRDTTLLFKTIHQFAGSLSSNSNLLLTSKDAQQFQYQPLDVRREYLKYDSAANVLHAIDDGAKNVCYVYSYHRSKLIAIVENASYANIEILLGGAANIDNFSKSDPSDSQVITFLAPLRSSSTLEDARISTFIHSPVGLTRETDPNGQSTFYEYDNFGRTMTIRDNDSVIVRTFCYNYAGQVEDCGKGRTDYAMAELDRFTTTFELCNPGPVVQTIVAYSPRLEPKSGTGGIFYPARNEFYLDPTLTTPVPDGFYKNHGTTGPITGSRYYYVVNGKYVYSNICGFASPTMLKYSDTTFINMCSAALPSVPVFGSISTGNTLYADMGLNPKIKDGYYISGTNYFRATNGVVGSMIACSTLVAPTDEDVTFSETTASCLATRTYKLYYRGTVAVGTQMYSDYDCTFPLSPGSYSNSIRRYTVNASGVVTAISACF